MLFGVAEDIDLSGLVDRKLQSISVSAERLELDFDDDWSLSFECSWCLEGSAGSIAEGDRDALLDDAEKLTRLVGSVIEFAVPRPPDRIEIDFGKQGRLILIDDSELLESFSIDPIGIVV
ncbi:MAG: hypothetical protein CL797_01790 [Chromatiales bacterium]|nr:hypothetical protein [Chromatiales bacterium]